MDRRRVEDAERAVRRASKWIVQHPPEHRRAQPPLHHLGVADFHAQAGLEPDHERASRTLPRASGRAGERDRWWFLTGDQREIYCLAKDGFHLSVIDSSAAQPLTCGRA